MLLGARNYFKTIWGGGGEFANNAPIGGGAAIHMPCLFHFCLYNAPFEGIDTNQRYYPIFDRLSSGFFHYFSKKQIAPRADAHHCQHVKKFCGCASWRRGLLAASSTWLGSL
jgi:hypothetical protein